MEKIEIIVIVLLVLFFIALIGRYIYRRIKRLPSFECCCCAKRMKKTILKAKKAIIEKETL